MPFLVSRSPPASAPQKATHTSLAVNPTVASSEPEISTANSSNLGPVRLPTRHNKKSSTTSIFKSSISQPTSLHSTESKTPSTIRQPLGNTEAAFDRPRRSPIPPSSFRASQQSPSPPVRPTSYTAVRRSSSPPTRSNQLQIPQTRKSRTQSRSSDTKEPAAVAPVAAEDTSVPIEERQKNGEQPSPTSIEQSSSAPVVRYSVYKPIQREERPRRMTAW